MRKKAKKGIKPLTREQMESLTTRNLLSYLRRLHMCYDQPDWDLRRKYIYKSSPEWQELRATAKNVLATREHTKE